jgi:rifampicin phosphotransferase
VKTILRDADVNVSDAVGGKAATLARLRSWIQGRGVTIPQWFVLTPHAFEVSLTPQQRAELLNACNDATRHRLVDQVSISPDVLLELRAALAELCPNGETVAVRSSALDEDGRQFSFAGQLESFLFVAHQDVASKIAAVWQSGFGERVAVYRHEHGLSSVSRAPAVLIQRIVDADAAGVAFGADPATLQLDVAVISAVRGVAAELVSGKCEGETYRLRRPGNDLDVERSQATNAILTNEQVRAIAELAWSVGQFLGGPQDIEWAYQGTQLYLLQARPITTLDRPPETAGELCLWDNSNIAESYNGITTPLTFSFARRAYEEVYRQFCRLLCVPEAKTAQNDDVFRNMLGLIRGRVYYNLLNWYRALAMLPGFQFNRRFMEQMMGVKEPLPDAVLSELAQATWRERLRDGFNMLRSIGALIGSHLTIERRKRRFLKRLDDALGTTRPDLSQWRLDELARHYRDLERQLLPHWDAPLVNDFLAMIFFGLLRKSVAKWCGEDASGLHNDLLAHDGRIASAEPAAAIQAMAEIARQEPALLRVLEGGSNADFLAMVNHVPFFKERFDAYLQCFGDRCFEELKLESPTLHDDPTPLLRSIAGAVQRLPPERQQESPAKDHPEARVQQAIGFRPMRRLLFRWLLRNARDRVRDRENLRFERTRLFARARQIFVEFGRRFHAIGALDDPHDVFFLEVNEILGFVEGTATSSNLRGLATLRKDEFNRYRRMPAPPSRFETRGAIHHGNAFDGAQADETEAGEVRHGLGCCAGVVRGRVRVVVDPRQCTLRAGEILVAERTDPGWIMLFPAASGLVVERGSLLSHSAIVARELGLPAVVSVSGVTNWLRNGDVIELDGRTGIVTRLERAEAPADEH